MAEKKDHGGQEKQKASPAERLARKLKKREKQRAANIVRASEMHAERIAFKTPDAQSHNKLETFNIGCSGWFYWHWRGGFYPAEMPTKSWFSHYSDNFPTVELNAPFYSWPTVKTVKEWLRQMEGKDFVYTVKVCELITHVKRMSRTRTLVEDFGLIADLLGEKMGCFLFQLPPSYHYSAARLKTLLGQLDPSRRNVVEFRHKSWWNERVYAAFRKTGTIFCSCSGPRLPDELVKTADDVYIRFHGLTKWYRHDYTDEELQLWVSRIRDSGCKRVWAYFNNDRDGHAIRNAKEFTRQLRAL
ncbi:DUF72 domain-containing protein [Luteolibacter sp. GHJ8]|uniref:DUF72 domain-containing protein n=1 Tax=Luteolibacter rhizosphaerae TaxID=2989719 RepID=A0ABT3FZD8_9BACT|nr:DUF72 domain-containing protein [Luteolibacter rhizosphaerae]MCW1912941.1 DUF72 domain-containing protein [Luteolibacter rhizosphaerae]